MKQRCIKNIFLIFTLLFAIQVSMADVHIVSIGINRYKSFSMLPNPEDDAKDFAELCKQYPDAHVTLVTGRYATTKRLKQVIADRYANTKADDVLIFYFSGHGTDAGCATFDAQSMDDFLSFRFIASAMKASPAKRKIIISDACKSGSSKSNADGTKVHNDNDPNVVLFMSSRANEYSLASRKQRNSVFTQYLLQGLRGEADVNNDTYITARELFDFVSPRVIDYSNGRQHPVMWGNFDEDFIIMRR